MQTRKVLKCLYPSAFVPFFHTAIVYNVCELSSLCNISYLSSVKFTDNPLDLSAFIFIDLGFTKVTHSYVLDYEIQHVFEIVVQAVCW